MNTAMPHISFIKFSNLFNWSVSHLTEDVFAYSIDFPLVRIGQFLIKNDNQVVIKSDKIYQRVTVKINNGGVFSRDIVEGNRIGTKRQFIVSKGQFIISKIDARNGAMGIIPEALDGAIVTNDFPTFNIEVNKILPEFLLLITTTKKFIAFAQSCSSGTTNRQRIDIKKFLDVKIPLPPINDKDAQRRNLSNIVTQEKLIAAYNQKLDEAENAKRVSLEKEATIDDFIITELGIDKAKTGSATTGLSFVKFKTLDRWDVWTSKSLSSSSAYSFLKFREILNGKPVYGANVRGVKKKSDTRYIRITDINEDGSLNENIVYPEYVEEKYLLRDNDFLIARSGNTVGKTFLYKSFMGRAIYAGYLVKYDLNQHVVMPEYVLAFTKSSMFKKWVNSNQRVSGQPNINGQEYLEFPIIVPDRNTQKRIVDKIEKIREDIKREMEVYNRLRKSAIFDFEQQIFKRNQ